MLKISIDTCVLIDSIIKVNQEYKKFFQKLYNQHRNGLSRIMISRPVQFELYGLLRAGRLKRWNFLTKEYEHYQYSHEEILEYLEDYKALFDIKFINSLEWNNKYTFLRGDNKKGIPNYKDDYEQFIINEYGWTDWGLEFIEEHVSKASRFLQIPDKYDYPIMAAAIKDECLVLITDNLGHFAKPLGTCLVVNTEQARNLDLFDDYFELMAMNEI